MKNTADAPSWADSTWKLSDSFRFGANTKGNPPKVGDTINEWTILGAWTNDFGYLKGFKVQCSCGNVIEYARVDHIKNGSSTKCRDCHNKTRESTRFFKNNYPLRDAKKLADIFKRKSSDERVFVNGPTFYEPWLTDYKAFADYWISLPKWDEYKDQNLPWRHPDQLTPDRIDTTKGYVPGNIRFSTWQEQMRNTTRTLYIKFNKRQIKLMDFIEHVLGPQYECSRATGFIRSRHSEGLTANEILKMMRSPDFDLFDHEHIKIHFSKAVTNERS